MDNPAPELMAEFAAFLDEWEAMKASHARMRQALALAMKLVTRHSPAALRSFPETAPLMKLLEGENDFVKH